MSNPAKVAGRDVNLTRPARQVGSGYLLMKTGGVTGVIGALLAFITNGLHPHPSDFRLEALLVEIAQNPAWPAVHLGLIFGLVLIFAALLAFTLSVLTEPAATVARFAALVTLLGGTLILVSTAMDGFAMNLLARSWVQAAPDDKSNILRVADAMENAQYAVFSLSIILFMGAGIILYGVAILLTSHYPKMLGWLAIFSGVGLFLVGIIQIFNGPSYRGTELFDLIFSLLATLWVLILGIVMWRKAV